MQSFSVRSGSVFFPNSFTGFGSVRFSCSDTVWTEKSVRFGRTAWPYYSHLIKRQVFSVAILFIFLFEKLHEKIGIEKLLNVNVVSTHFRAKHKNYAIQSDHINLIPLFYLRISFLAST